MFDFLRRRSVAAAREVKDANVIREDKELADLCHAKMREVEALASELASRGYSIDVTVLEHYTVGQEHPDAVAMSVGITQITRRTL